MVQGSRWGQWHEKGSESDKPDCDEPGGHGRALNFPLSVVGCHRSVLKRCRF